MDAGARATRQTSKQSDICVITPPPDAHVAADRVVQGRPGSCASWGRSGRVAESATAGTDAARGEEDGGGWWPAGAAAIGSATACATVRLAREK